MKWRAELIADPAIVVAVSEQHVWKAIQANGGRRKLTQRGLVVGPWLFRRVAP